MRKRKRPARARAFVRGGLAAGLAAASGCSGSDNGGREPASDVLDAGNAGAAGSAGAAGRAGADAASGAGGAPPIFLMPAYPLPADLLDDQGVVNDAPLQRVLYSWTTDSQYQELRDGAPLLSRTERPGVGQGLLRQRLSDYAMSGDTLAQALTAERFQRARYAWPNPWATVMGWPGEVYGNKLIRIELREDAWIAVLLAEGTIDVFDEHGAPVTREDALATPERIGAIYHFHTPADPSRNCQGSFLFGGSGTFREYFLPNPDMIARWSLATQAMRDRLIADLAELERYRDHLQLNSSRIYGDFPTAAMCTWSGSGLFSQLPGEQSYLQSLAFASGMYEPTPAKLDLLIATLELALFEPDPFVVEGE